MSLSPLIKKLRAVIPAAALILAGFLAYGNSFQGKFVYDDIRAIINNPHIRQVFPLIRSLTGPGDSSIRDRPVVSFSLALNYAAGGLAPRGYHLFNLAIHILAGLTLFGILRQTFQNPLFPSAINHSATGLSFFAALVWLLHPLQTESVTYIIQRSESLAGLFYLLTLYCFIRGAGTRQSWIWFGGAFLFCGLGMGTKAIMVTAPVLVFLYDSIFISGSAAQTVRRHWPGHLALAATWLIQVFLISRTSYSDLKILSPLSYLLTQPSVITRYLRLTLCPHPLCLDYGWPLAQGIGDVLPGAILIGGLLWLTVYGLFKKPVLGFAGAWFFLILAPTSSILPLEDPLSEHRMYLPLAAIAALAAASGFSLLRRFLPARQLRPTAGVLTLASALLLGHLTRERNRIYSDPIALWYEVSVLRPEHARGYYNYGLELGETGRRREAIVQYREAIRLKPDYALAYNNLGVALSEEDSYYQAIARYGQAIRLNPHYWEARYNLGIALSQLGKDREALTSFQESLRLQPHFAPAYLRTGDLLQKMSRHREAAAYYQKALKINPDCLSAIQERITEIDQTGDQDLAPIYHGILNPSLPD